MCDMRYVKSLQDSCKGLHSHCIPSVSGRWTPNELHILHPLLLELG